MLRAVPARVARRAIRSLSSAPPRSMIDDMIAYARENAKTSPTASLDVLSSGLAFSPPKGSDAARLLLAKADISFDGGNFSETVSMAREAAEAADGEDAGASGAAASLGALAALAAGDDVAARRAVAAPGAPTWARALVVAALGDGISAAGRLAGDAGWPGGAAALEGFEDLLIGPGDAPKAAGTPSVALPWDTDASSFEASPDALVTRAAWLLARAGETRDAAGAGAATAAGPSSHEEASREAERLASRAASASGADELGGGESDGGGGSSRPSIAAATPGSTAQIASRYLSPSRSLETAAAALLLVGSARALRAEWAPAEAALGRAVEAAEAAAAAAGAGAGGGALPALPLLALAGVYARTARVTLAEGLLRECAKILGVDTRDLERYGAAEAGPEARGGGERDGGGLDAAGAGPGEAARGVGDAGQGLTSPAVSPSSPPPFPPSFAGAGFSAHRSVHAALSWRYAQLLTALPRRGTEAKAWKALARAAAGGRGDALEGALGGLGALRGEGRHGRGLIIDLRARRALFF